MKKNLQLFLLSLICYNFAFAQITTILDFETANTSTNFYYFGTNGGTYEGAAANILFNPDQSGINLSDSIGEFVKEAGSYGWSGMYTDPNPTSEINFVNGGKLCLKVWSPVATSVSVKLENSTTGGANWITTQPITTTNEWIDVCFDSALPSIEAPATPATGNSYATLVIFFDFGTPGGNDNVAYYFDDIVVDETVDVNLYPVTFNVDMNNYSDAFTQVNVMSSFNAWSLDGNPLTDNGDGTWSVTVDLPIGSYEYIYNVDGVAENFPTYSECAKVTFDGANVFSNRIFTVTQATVLDMHMWESCYDASDDVIDITFHVNMDGQYVSPDGVYLAGGVSYGHGEFPMMDEDNDGFYSITFQRLSGYDINTFTFINGICYQYWDCKEDISYQSCAVLPFNDRELGVVTTDTMYSTCFGDCSTEGACAFVSDTTTSILAFNSNQIQINPTLVKDFVIIDIKDNFNQLSYNVSDLNGKILETAIIENGINEKHINLAGLAKGIYFINISNDKYFTTQKIIKL